MGEFVMETRKNDLKQYFEEILANISEQEFESFLKQVEPFSQVGPEVLHYMQYTESWIEANTFYVQEPYLFENQMKWFDTNDNILFAA